MSDKEYTLPDDVRLSVDPQKMKAEEREELLSFIKFIKSKNKGVNE